MLEEAVRTALREAGFAERSSGRTVAVVVPDATRALDVGAVLDPLLAAVSGGARGVTMVVATGLHRPPTERERRPWIAVARRHRATLVDHDARAQDGLVTLREDVGGLRAPLCAQFARPVVEADLRVVVGRVEPHQYAGFSGGVKTIAIGCAGVGTIAELHGLELLRHRGTRLGAVDGNPFRAALDRLAGTLGPVWALQLVPPSAAGEWAVFAGPVEDAFVRAVRVARRRQFVPTDGGYDRIELSVPPEKAQSFYQASRAATYAALVEHSALAPGGVMVLKAACPEGLGTGAGEGAFARALSRGPEALAAELAGTRVPPRGAGGAQRAYVLVKTLALGRLAVQGAAVMPELAPFGIIQAGHPAEIDRVFGPGRRTLEVNDPFGQIPVVRVPE